MKFRKLDESKKIPYPGDEFEYLPKYEKREIVDDILKKLPNYETAIKPLKTIYINSLIENGFEYDNNPFVYFIENIKFEISPKVLQVIDNKMQKRYGDKGELDPKSKWLYTKNLYTEEDRNTIWKINALSYFMNHGETLKGKNGVVTLEDLLKHIKSKNRMSSVISKAEIQTEKTTKPIKEIIGGLITKDNRNVNVENLSNGQLIKELDNRLKQLVNKEITKDDYESIHLLLDDNKIWDKILKTEIDKKSKLVDIADYIIEKWK